MENLLDGIDGLVAPGLSTETPDWCVNCQSLRQELKQLKEEHCQNFGRLKQKIINTDLLIKKFKAKCDDFDVQCKKTDEANKRADKFQRQCEILETQLKAALMDTEPLKKTKASLEEELKAKKIESQMLSDRLIATESAWKQYEHLSKANSSNLEALESENKELMKKIKVLESGKMKKETAKEFKSEIVILKKENNSLKKENSSLKNIEERLQKRLLLANKNIDNLNKSLKEKASSPRMRRRASPMKSPFHSPRIAKYTSPTKSPVRFNSPTKSPVINRKLLLVSGTSRGDVPSTSAEKKLDFDDDSSIDDSDDDESSVAWTFSPITQCISPLPPSPACFVNQLDVDGEVSDIADDLEQFLHHNEDYEQVGNEENQVAHIDKIEHINNDEVDDTCRMDIEKPVSNNTGDVCDREKELQEPHEDVSEALDNQPDDRTGSHVPESQDVLVEQENSQVKSLDNEQQDINKDRNKPLLEQVNHEGKTLAVSESEAGGSGSCRKSVKERIAGAIEIISPKSVKKVFSPIKKIEGNNCARDSVQTLTRSPAIRRSARIQSKRDSETSEVESDSNVDKISTATNNISDNLTHANNTDQACNNDISDNLTNTDNTDQAGNNTSCSEAVNECVPDIIFKPDNSSVVKDADQSNNPESVLKNENVDTSSINSPESVKVNESLDSDNGNNISNTVNNDMKEKENRDVDMEVETSECLESNEVEVWREVQTKTVIPKPLPNRSCLLRQKAVSHKVGPSHLFDDLQAMRGKTEGCKDNITDKSKSKFGAHKFIPFQRSSEGTLSNEIENLHSAHDYEVISREQTDNQDIERPALSSKDRKKLRRKMRKNCKYIDRDSEVYGRNNNNNNTYTSPAESLDSKFKLTTNENSIFKNVLNTIVESTDPGINEHVASMKCDINPGSRNETETSVSDKPGTVCDNDMEVTDSVLTHTDSAASRKTLEVSNTLHVPDTDVNDGSDKVVPSRQMSTGFSVNSVSLERASSTESGVSMRSSPARLCMLETGSCDTIIEQVDEHSNSSTDLTIDKCDDKVEDKGGDNLIFGVEDIMESEYEAPCDKQDNTPHSFLLKCDTNDANTHSVLDDTIISDIQSTHSEMFASYNKPGCSGYNSKTSDNQSHVKLKEENSENSFHLESVVEEFGNDDESSRSSTASFSMLGRDSPLSDIFLSRFEFLNPVSPLPPSPVRELESDHDDEPCETGVDDDAEFENKTMLCKVEKSLNDNNQSVCDTSLNSSSRQSCPVNQSNSSSREGCLMNKSNSSSREGSLVNQSKGKALLKKSTSSCNKSASSCATRNDSVTTSSDSSIRTIPGTPEAVHIKVEHLKMSPLPGMISPLRSPAVKHCKHQSMNRIGNINVKIERNIMKESDRTVKSEADDILVSTRSRTSIGKQSSSSSSAQLGTCITKKRKGTLGKKSKTTACSGVLPVRKSALVDKILRQRAETVKEKPTPAKCGPVTSNTPADSDVDNYDNSEPSQDLTIPNDTKSLTETLNVKSDTKTSTTLAVMGGDDTTVVDTAKENADSVDRQCVEQIVADSVDDKGNVLEELPTGHDNLAFKRKTRVAHKPNMLPLKPPKVPIIDAPHLPPVLPGRKRRSADGGNNVIQDKKPCKQSSFRRQKNESCLKKEDTRRMQAFLKSTDPADKLVSIVTEIHGAECGNILLLSCLECIGRVMTDPLDVVFENCVTDAYHSIHTDFPFLSDVEKRAVYLICHLIDNKHIKKAQLMRSAWDTVLCRHLSVNVIGKMAQCRLFIALCAVQGNLELARVMVYQIVTCTHLNFVLFIVPVTSVWPEVLRKNPADSPDLVLTHGLTLVLEELITERLLAMDDELSKKIVLVLKKLCRWSGVCGNSENILKTLVTKLQTCTSDDTPNHCAVFELTKAVNLLCASRAWSWVKVNFIERHGLQPAAYKYTAKLITKPISPIYMCALLRVTSYILSVHAATIREKDYQQIIRNWLLPVLYKASGDDTVHVCCVETLIELTPLYPTCLDMIHRWYQQEQGNISEELVLRLEDLRTQYKQQFGLVCKSFTKS